jgi:hypothetical protein
LTLWTAKEKGREAYLTPRPFWSALNDLMYAFSDIPLMRTASARSNITWNLSNQQTKWHGSQQSLDGSLHGQFIEQLTSKPRLTWTQRSPGRWWPCRPRPAKAYRSEARPRGGRRTGIRGRWWAVRAAYDAEDRGVEVDVAEAAELAGLADDGAGPREAEARGDRRHVHGRRRVRGERIGAGSGDGEREADLGILARRNSRDLGGFRIVLAGEGNGGRRES